MALRCADVAGVVGDAGSGALTAVAGSTMGHY